MALISFASIRFGKNTRIVQEPIIDQYSDQHSVCISLFQTPCAFVLQPTPLDLTTDVSYIYRS